MGLHTPEQIQEKRDAIQIATKELVKLHIEGNFDNYKNEELLFHLIESLNSLVLELKRG